jgi:telomerase reverse transcriptase
MIPDVFSLYPNGRFKALKAAPWPHILALLGQSGEAIMIDLLLDCSIFIAVEAGFQNYYQLNGQSYNMQWKCSDLMLI